MKKLFSIILSLLIVFSLTTAVFAVGYVDRTGWIVTASSERISENYTADRVIDGNANTYWHTNYVSDTNKDEAPFYLTFYLPEKTTISGFSYLPRQGNTTGVATKYNIYASGAVSGNAFLIHSGTLKEDTNEKKVSFGYSVEVRTIVFEITEGKWGYGACAEFNLLAADGSAKKTVAQVSKGETVAIEYTTEYVDRTGWRVTASSERTSENFTADRVIDRNANTYWHTNYVSDTNKDEAPFYLTFYLPEKTTISGFSYLPRQGNTTGVATKYNIYASGAVSGNAFLIHSGTLKEDTNEKKVSFGYSVEVRTIVFEITEGKWGYGACAEFNLLAADGSAEKTVAQVSQGKTVAIEYMAEYVDRTGWRVTASSERKSENFTADRVIDGKTNTYWHTDYVSDTNKDEAPFYLTFYLPEKTTISGFSYLPRQGNTTGAVTAYNIYASDSDSGENVRIYTGTMVGDESAKMVPFGFTVDVKKVVFEITAGMWGYGTCAEFYLVGDDGSIKKSLTQIEQGIGDGAKIQDKSSWTAVASSQKSYYPAKYAIDGNTESFWHSDYTDDGKNIISQKGNPHWIEVTLPEMTVISGFSYTPRTTPSTGRIYDYEFYASDSDNGELKLIYSGVFEDSPSEKEVRFPANVEIKKFKFKSLTSASNFGVVSELDIFVGSSEIKTAANIDEFIKICEDGKLIAIPGKKITATASSEWGNNTAMMAIDGIPQTTWHSSTDNWNTAGYFPVILNVDLGASYKIHEIAYYARKDAENTMNGIWTKYNIWAGDNEQNLKLIKENAALELTLDTQTIAFDEPVVARYFKFEIKSGHTKYATCADLLFYEKASDANERVENKTKYTLQIGSNNIKIVENGAVRTETMDVAPYIDKGYTMIPLRGLLEQMGATVNWDRNFHRITIVADGVTISMQTFKKLVTVTDRIYGEVRYTLRTVPWVKDSRAFVPLRFISENLGYEVTWNADTQEITIVK